MTHGQTEYIISCRQPADVIHFQTISTTLSRFSRYFTAYQMRTRWTQKSSEIITNYELTKVTIMSTRSSARSRAQCSSCCSKVTSIDITLMSATDNLKMRSENGGHYRRKAEVSFITKSPFYLTSHLLNASISRIPTNISCKLYIARNQIPAATFLLATHLWSIYSQLRTTDFERRPHFDKWRFKEIHNVIDFGRTGKTVRGFLFVINIHVYSSQRQISNSTNKQVNRHRQTNRKHKIRNYVNRQASSTVIKLN